MSAFATPLSLALALVLVVACGGPSTPPAASATASPTVFAATSATPSAGSPATSAPFLRTALTDVRSGERFMLGGFVGKTVIVQGMAVW